MKELLEPVTLVLMLFWGAAIFATVYLISMWVNRWYEAYEAQFVQSTEQDLYGMFSSIPPQRVLQASIGLFLVVTTISLFVIGTFHTIGWGVFTTSVSLLLGGIAYLLPHLFIKRAAKKRIEKFNLQLLDGLLSMSNALKAGFSIIQTFEALVQEKRDPLSQEFDLMLREIRLGVKFEVATENLMRRVPSEDLEIVITGIETARQTGGNLTEVFDRLAVVIRERMRVQGRIQTLTAQGRMQGWAVGMMPFVMGVAVYYIQPNLMTSFVTSTGGIFLICIMILLVAIGAFFIRKIINIDV